MNTKYEYDKQKLNEAKNLSGTGYYSSVSVWDYVMLATIPVLLVVGFFGVIFNHYDNISWLDYELVPPLNVSIGFLIAAGVILVISSIGIYLSDSTKKINFHYNKDFINLLESMPKTFTYEEIKKKNKDHNINTLAQLDNFWEAGIITVIDVDSGERIEYTSNN